MNCARGTFITSDQNVFGRLEVQPVVQVHLGTHAPLVDLEEAGASHVQKNRIMPASAVGETDVSVALRPLPGVERDARGEEGVVAQGSDAATALGVELGDLAQLGFVERVRAALRAVAAGRRGELDVADPERHRRLRDAERGGDVGERAAVGPHPARLLLFLDLAAVAHVGRLIERVFDEQSLIARWA